MTATIDRVAFTVFGIEIYWYSILIIIGIVVGMYFAQKKATAKGYSPDLIADIMMVALPAAIVGARLYFVAFEWENYRHDFMAIINVRSGGLAIHGGLLGAVAATYIFSKVKKIPFMEITDFFFPSVALGQAIGRWGNFINQEAHGGPTDLPWGIIVEGQKVHPAFLYESIGDFLIFLFLNHYYHHYKREDGEVFALYLVLYGILRFFVESVRTDSLMVLGVRTAQLVSIVGILVGVVMYIYLRNRSSHQQDKKIKK